MSPRAAVVALILALAGGALASRLSLGSDLARLLPDAGPAWREAARQLERVAVIDVAGDAAAADRFEERLGYPVRAAPTEADLLAAVDLLRERAACYVTDYDRLQERLRDVPGRLQSLARQLQEPGGFGTWAAQDPLGFGVEALRGLEGLAAGFDAARVDAHGVVSADGSRRLLLVRPGFPPGDLDRTRAFVEAVARAGEGLSVRHVGAHRSTLDNATAIRADATRAALIGTLAVALLAVFVFRRLSVAVLAVLPGAFGAVIALGITALFRTDVPLAVVGFACVLLGITVDFAIHVLAGKRAPVRAILMGATTTATAFICLRASVLPGLRDMGTLGALGVLAAAFFAIFVLRPGGEHARLPPTRALQSRPVLVLLLIALPFALAGWTRVEFAGDPTALTRLTDDAARDERGMRETWGAAFSTTTVLVRAATVEDALQKNDAVARALGDRPHASLHALLPSRATQRARIARWRAFWTEARIEALGRELAAATEGTPFAADAFAPCLAWLRTDPDPVVPQDLPATLWDDRLAPDGNGWQVSTPVFDPDLTSVPGAIVVNPRGMVRRLAELVREETVHLGLLAGIGVAGLCALWFGRLWPVAIILLPLLLGTACTIGLLGWFGVPITLANAAFVVFLFGLAIDYGIFLAEARSRRAATGVDGTERSDRAVTLCALTTCVGFGVLLTADHPVLSSIGATALTGIATSLLFVQALVPRLWRPRRPGPGIDGLYGDQGPMIRAYARGKAKRDPAAATFAELPASTSTLVAGCGYGIMAARRLLVHPGEHLIGMDCDASKIEVVAGALRRYPHARFETADVRDAELGSHQLVTAVDLLHYFPEDGQEAVARRLADAVEPGGLLLFREGCTDRPGHRRVERWERIALVTWFTRTRDGLHFRTESAWRTLWERCGLSVEPIGEGPGSNVIFLCRKPTS